MTDDLPARYARAESLLPHNLRKLIDSPKVSPNWIRDTETFWYRNTTGAGTEFVLVDAAAGTKQPAFDHLRLADALREVTGQAVEPDALPFFGIRLDDDVVRVVVDEQSIEVSVDTYAATIAGPARSEETLSPDGCWSVGLDDHNLYLRDTATDEVRQLTTDGAEAYSYATMADACSNRVMQENLGFTTPPLVVWSPDSTRFLTHRLDQRDLELMHLVRSSPIDGGRPKPMTYRYAMVGEEHLATADFFVIDAATGTTTQAKCEPMLVPYVSPLALGHAWWDDDSTTCYWLSSDRGDRTVRLYDMDASNGEITVLVEETGGTSIQHGPHFQDRNVRVLTSGEVLWWSQRDGWAHLYLHGTDGQVTAVTSGDWLVRRIVSVDEDARRVLFTAAGCEAGADVYLQELYSVSLDGGEVTAVTADGLDHDCLPSRSGRYSVDVMSRVDVPAISVLRDHTGTIVMELEQADAAALYAAGWTPPERVVVKSADGVTDIHCAVYTPFDFDPSKTYPVLDEIYAAPQISTAPLRFPLSGGVMTGERHGTIFAALGFAVVAVDGRGSALRHRTFQDHARRNGDGQYIADHVAAIRQLAASRPWMDLDRVGIYGHSGGGRASTKAMLTEPDFFKAAVSSAGDHDDRMYHSWWGEKYFGLAEEFDFDAYANVALADILKGKLLLVHGEMDDNVTPHLTMRLVDALMKANKDFDLLIVPNADHFMHVHGAYWQRRRWDYFVQHLMGETPPAYRIADIPVDPELLAGMTGA